MDSQDLYNRTLQSRLTQDSALVVNNLSSTGGGGNLEPPNTAISPLVVTEGNSAQSFEVKSRVTPSLTTFPVPLIRPTTTNKVLALDIMPNGTPLDLGDNGVAWIDVCNVDVHNNESPVAAARLGIGTTKAQIGTVVFQGYSTVLPIEFLQNSVVRFRINANTSMDFFTSAITITNGVTAGSFIAPLFKSAASGNVSFVAQPVGNGGFQLQPTDGGTAGGNARGTNAVDLQMFRAAATQVASGGYSFVGGGIGNSALGTASASFGYFTSSNGLGSVSFGNFTSVAADYGFAANNSGLANGIGSSVFGAFGLAKNLENVFVLGCGKTASSGKFQSTLMSLGAVTTNATPQALSSNNSAANQLNQLTLQNNSAIVVKGLVVAGITGAGDTKSWEIDATIKRGANAASTTLVGTPTVNVLHADAGAAAWVISVTADTSNGSLAVTVTNGAGVTVRTGAVLVSSEVAF